MSQNSKHKHTALPWDYDAGDFTIYSLEGDHAANATIIGHSHYEPVIEADAEFITRSCNSHYELVGALEAAKLELSTGSRHDALRIVEKAIARANGQEVA